MNQASIALIWRLRRAAAEMRLLDVYLGTGISVSRYRLIERGKRVPTALERRLIEEALPPLPSVVYAREDKTPREVTSV